MFPSQFINVLHFLRPCNYCQVRNTDILSVRPFFEEGEGVQIIFSIEVAPNLKFVSVSCPIPRGIIITTTITLVTISSTNDEIIHSMKSSTFRKVLKCAEGRSICCDGFNRYIICCFWRSASNNDRYNSSVILNPICGGVENTPPSPQIGLGWITIICLPFSSTSLKT